MTCKQEEDVPTIRSVQVMASNQKDWEMLVWRDANLCIFQTKTLVYFANFSIFSQNDRK